MNKIEVTNSAIIINDYKMGDCTGLERYFKVEKIVTNEYHTYEFKALYYDEENKKLYLPRGIDIWFVEKELGIDANVKYNAYTKFKKFDNISIETLPRDDIQKEALRFTLSQREYRGNAEASQLSLNLFTGKGKTYVMLTTMAYLGIRGIVITASTKWLKQWGAKAIEYTNINRREICMIEGSGAAFKLLSMPKEKIDKTKLFLVTHSTLHSFGTTYGWNRVTELFEYLEIGIKIFDEAHLNFDNICMVDYFTNVFRTYYVTATASRSARDENRVYQLCFKNIPSIDLYNPDEDPHTSYICMQYSSNPTPRQISDCKNMYGLNRNKYINYVVGQPEFFKAFTIILSWCAKFAPLPDQKILIYIGTNEAIKIVREWMIQTFPFMKNDIGVFTSIYSDEEKSVALTKKFILSTTKSAGAAMDIKGLKATVILAEPFKSEPLTIQTLGRTRDNNTYCIELVDRAFVYCLRYYYAKSSVIEKYAKDCQVVKMSMNEIDAKYNMVMETMTMPKAFTIQGPQPAFSYF